MSKLVERIPFEVAINDKRLFKKKFDSLSIPQKTALKAFYGIDLDEQELEYWAMFQGNAKFDHLGFLESTTPTEYEPTEYDEAWVIFGRRSAKTSGFLAWILAYESTLGGHESFKGEKQEIASFFVAQKLDIAQAALRDFVEPIIASSPITEKMIIDSNIKGIKLKNEHNILPAPPVIKNFRYYAIPVAVLDECAFWYKDADSANPDYEVIRAIEPAQGQFINRKMIGASTVWTKEGIIWEAANAGTFGKKLPEDDEQRDRFSNALVLMAPTAALQNPVFNMDGKKDGGRKWLQKQFKKDPDAFSREYLVKFSDAISGLFKESMLRKATEGSPTVHPPKVGPYYIATCDPAFRGDNFTFCIGHYERERGYVQDVIKAWSPSKGEKLKPSVILDAIKVDLKQYNIDVLYSDQHQLESLQELAADRDISMVGIDWTGASKPRMFATFLRLMRDERIKLLRNAEQMQEFLFIQKIVGSANSVRISAPQGKHDDHVTVTVMNAALAIKFESSSTSVEEKKEETLFDRVMKHRMRKPEPDSEFL